jgi:hypothetical protein
MTNANTAKKTTPADVVAQATEEKLVVPAQQTVEVSDESVTVIKSDEQEDTDVVGLTLIEGGKQSLKNKFSGLVTKAGQHKKALLGTVAVIGVITFTAVKYAKKQVEEVLDESATETTENETLVVDESAA